MRYVRALFTSVFFLTLGAADDSPKDADRTVPIPASFQSADGERLRIAHLKRDIVISIPYAMEKTKLYPLPNWIITATPELGENERTMNRFWTKERALTEGDIAKSKQIRIRLLNAQNQNELKPQLDELLKKRVSRDRGTKPEAFTIESPKMGNTFVATLYVSGTGGGQIPQDIPLSAPVELPQLVVQKNGEVIFDLLPDTLAAVIKSRGQLKAEDVYLRIDGEVRARFEVNQLAISFTIIREQLEKTLSRVVTNAGPPSVLVHVPSDGEGVQTTTLRSLLSSEIQIGISERSGAKIDPGYARALTMEVLQEVIRTERLGSLAEKERVTLLMGNQLTLSGTVGEVRKLSRMKAKEREEQLKLALEDSRKRESDKTYKNKLADIEVADPGGRRWGSTGIRLGIAPKEETSREKEERETREALATLQKGIDTVKDGWEGKRLEFQTLRLDAKAEFGGLETRKGEIIKTLSTLGWFTHTWPLLRLAETTSTVIDPAMLDEQNRIAAERYEGLKKLFESKDKWEGFDKAISRVETLEKNLIGYREQVDRLNREKAELAKLLDKGVKRQRDLETMLRDLPVAEEAFFTASDMVKAIALSQKGDKLVSATGTVVSILDSKSGDLTRSYKVHQFQVWSVAHSPVEPWIASSGVGYAVHHWNRDSANKSDTLLAGHTAIVFGLAYSPDGKFLVSAGADNCARVWNLETRKEIATYEGHQNTIWCVAFSQDGKYVFTGDKSGFVHKWQTANAKLEWSKETNGDSVNTIAVSPDGKWLLFGGEDNKVHVYSTSDGSHLKTFVGHTGPVYGVAFVADGWTAVSASKDGTIRLWDLYNWNKADPATWTHARCFKGHTQAVNCLAVSPDGKRLYSGSDDKTIRVWRIPDIFGAK